MGMVATGLVHKRFSPHSAWDEELRAYLESALGKEAFQHISEALCRPPLSTCVRANTLKTTRKAVAAGLCTELESAGLLAESRVEEHPAVNDAVLVHGSGPHTVDYTPAQGKEAIISRKAGEAVLRGAHVYIPGVLACSSGVASGDLVAVCIAMEDSTGKPGITRGATVEHLNGTSDRSAYFIGLGRAQVSRKDMFRLQSGIAFKLEQPVFRTIPCNGILYGSVMAQNLPSLVAAHVLGPPAGSRVLDMCAAPGGKTTALAQIMGDRGQIIALDRSHSKVQDICQLAAELGVTCVSAHKMDATKACTARFRQKPAPAPTAKATVKDIHGGELAAPAALAKPGTAVSSAGSINTLSGANANGGPSHTTASSLEPALEPSDTVVLQANIPATMDAQERLGGPAVCDAAAAPAAAQCGLFGAPVGAADGVAVQPSAQQEVGKALKAAHKAVKLNTLSGEARVAERRRRKLAGAVERNQQPPVHADEFETGPQLQRFPPESFAYILLDAPCSALGLRPRLQQTADLPSLLRAAEYQRQMLDAAVALLQPGGSLVYSTCTINPGENEANVRYVLDRHPEVQLVPQGPLLGGPGLTGKCRVTEQRWLTEEESLLVQRFDPAGALDTIGFFIAKFQKIASSAGRLTVCGVADSVYILAGTQRTEGCAIHSVRRLVLAAEGPFQTLQPQAALQLEDEHRHGGHPLSAKQQLLPVSLILS